MPPTTHQLAPIAAPVLACGGRIHLERGVPVFLHPGAGSPRSRVAYLEDGAVFCASCALELARDEDGVR